jgi:hypothetical protein
MSITCGNHKDSNDLRKVVKHDSVASVRACYDPKVNTALCGWLVEIPTASLYPPEADWYPDSASDVYTTVECGSLAFFDAEGSFRCEAGHEHLAYGSAAQQAEERIEAAVEEWAGRDGAVAARLDAGESYRRIAGF